METECKNFIRKNTPTPIAPITIAGTISAPSLVEIDMKIMLSAVNHSEPAVRNANIVGNFLNTLNLALQYEISELERLPMLARLVYLRSELPAVVPLEVGRTG